MLNFCFVSRLVSWNITVTNKRCINQWRFVQYCHYVGREVVDDDPSLSS